MNIASQTFKDQEDDEETEFKEDVKEDDLEAAFTSPWDGQSDNGMDMLKKMR